MKWRAVARAVLYGLAMLPSAYGFTLLPVLTPYPASYLLFTLINVVFPIVLIVNRASIIDSLRISEWEFAAFLFIINIVNVSASLAVLSTVWSGAETFNT